MPLRTLILLILRMDFYTLNLFWTGMTFFIKNNSGKYVGAVLDITRDLFWYVLEEERKNGYLTKSLNEAIVPYLFSDVGDERAKQRITIKNGIGEANYLRSKKVAQSLVFKSTAKFSPSS